MNSKFDRELDIRRMRVILNILRGWIKSGSPREAGAYGKVLAHLAFDLCPKLRSEK